MTSAATVAASIAVAAATVLLVASANADFTPSGMGEKRARAADPWFPQVGDNLTRVNWAHAVNDRAHLAAVLASDVMMIEADIVLGHLIGAESSPALPIMAHPPAGTSDLSLADFLASIAAHNAAAATRDALKGVKLDFKSIEAFEASEPLLAPIAGDRIAYPVWLNADILPGPGNSTSVSVDSERFLRIASAFPRATLSVGWTTVASGEYTAQHTAAILSALTTHGVTQAVTFPVRAALAAGSGSVLRALVDDAAKVLQQAGSSGTATLTVWSSAGDAVDAQALREVMLAVGLDRVYLDVPEELEARLDLPDSTAVTSNKSFM